MEWTVAKCLNANQEVAAANHPGIRLATVGKTPFPEPQTDCEVSWQPCSPQTVGKFSGVAYYFGRELHRTLNVPIGLIKSSNPSTKVECWTPRSALMRLDYGRAAVKKWEQQVARYDAETAQRRYQAALEKWEQAKAAGKGRVRRPRPPADPGRNRLSPTVLYNGTIAPLMPFAIRGVAWYQGESDSHPPNCYEYRHLLPAMIGAWREGWAQGDFPFLCVQITSYSGTYGGHDGAGWPVVREAELLACRLPNVAVAVTIDNTEPGEIHPKNKQEVGRRLALAARHVAHGEDLVYSGPIYKSMRTQGSKIELTFDHVHAGLTAKGGQLTGFEIAGGDRRFLQAQADVRGDKVVVWHDQVSKPASVRYGWDNDPNCNLYNKDGLPASPFRTDDWPVPGHPDYEEGQ